MIVSFVKRVLSRALTLVWRHANMHSKLGLGVHHMTSNTFILFHIISFEFDNLHRVSPQEIELRQLLTFSEGVDAMYRYLARGLLWCSRRPVRGSYFPVPVCALLVLRFDSPRACLPNFCLIIRQYGGWPNAFKVWKASKRFRITPNAVVHNTFASFTSLRFPY